MSAKPSPRQLFVVRAAYDRVSDRLEQLASDLDVVVQEPDGGLSLRGRPVDRGALAPEISWLTVDSFAKSGHGYLGVITQAPTLKWVQIAFAGVEFPVLKPLARSGLIVTNSSASAPAIAEYATIHALSLLHPISQQAAHQRAHRWEREGFREIAQTRWLIVGFGSIGREIAKRAKAFGATIEVVRRAPEGGGLVDCVSTLADLPSRLPRADVVVLACALNEETRNLADARFFAAMKPGSILVNIGRGALVDEDALRSALDNDRPAHAVLDVFKTEPLPSESWFWDHPKVRVTAHASNRGELSGARGEAFFLDNLDRYLKGEVLINRVKAEDIGVGG